MNWMEFISAIVRAVAWPAVVMVAFVLLRKPLAGLVPFLKHLKYKEFELEFAQEVQDLRETANGALPPLVSRAPSVPEEEPLLRLASVSPRAAVVEAWRLVESSASHANEDKGIPVGKGGEDSIRMLRSDGTIDNATFGMISRLRSLRNQAVHAEEFLVDEASAREYVQLALALASQIHRGKTN